MKNLVKKIRNFINNPIKQNNSSDAQNNFISIASHQLKTPITSMRWCAETLHSKNTGPLNEEQKNLVEKIHENAIKLEDIVDLSLSLIKIESGKIAKKIIKINPIALTNDIIKELEPQFKQKNIGVNLIPSKEPMEVNYDALMLRQIITNLLSNSIRYNNDNGKIEIKMEKKKNELVYSVKDDGIGIPVDQQDKIFNKFFRADNASAVTPDGSGLGLSLAKTLVEINNGKIWFDSPTSWIDKNGKEEKKGTIFYFTLPL